MSVSAEREGMVIDLIVNEGLPSATVVSRTPVQPPSTATATTVAYSSCGRRSAVGPRSFAPRSSRKPDRPTGGLRDLRSHQPVAISHELTLAHEGERQRRAARFPQPRRSPDDHRPRHRDESVGRKQRSSPSIWRLTSSEVQLTALAHG